MASKVEELREQILGTHQRLEGGTGAGMSFGKYPCMLTPEIVDSLISASHAEGVAEGAEQERKRIRKTAQVWLTGDPPPNDTWYGVDKKELDPSVLASTKESEK